MKHITISFILSVFSSVLFAQVPVADFVHPNDCLGSLSIFSDVSTNTPTSWDWDFGDGSPHVFIQNPTHTFSAPGVYNVTLIATNGSGSDTVVKAMSIYPLPTINYLTHTQCGENGGDSATFDLTTLDNIVNGSSGETVNWYHDDSYTLPISNSSSFFVDVDTNHLMVYTQIVDGTYGCISSDSVKLKVAINDIVVTPDPHDVLCNGGCSGYIDLFHSGGAPPYTYHWTPGNMTTQHISSLCPGTYTYTITDNNGCIQSDNVVVNEPSALSLFLTPTDVSCYGAADGSINSTPLGGTPGAGYTYNWNDPLLQTTQNATGLAPGNYMLTVTDDNSCFVVEAADIYEPQPDGVIAGVINYQGAPIDMGAISLIKKDGNTPADLSLVSLQPIFTGGTFEFQNVEAGTYILKARGDTTLYDCVPTYSDGTVQWDLATEWDITSNCSNDSQYVSIDLIELPLIFGNGDINGRLVEKGGGFTDKAPGDPIPDIDITVEQSPGGTTMATATTNIGGYFTIENLPAGSYTIYADMHGYSMNISQTFDFDGSNTDMDIILCSNDTTDLIGMCQELSTSVSSETTQDNSIEIYPNPAKDILNIYNPENNAIDVIISDVTGKTILSNKLTDSSSKIDISDFVTGIYFIRIFNDHTNIYQKLIIE